MLYEPYEPWPHFPNSKPDSNCPPNCNNTDVDPREPPAPVGDEVEDLADALDGEFAGEFDEEYVQKPLPLTCAQRNSFGLLLPSS